MKRFLTPAEKSTIHEALMIAKVESEDALGLEASGHPSPYKPGALKRLVQQCNNALDLWRKVV